MTEELHDNWISSRPLDPDRDHSVFVSRQKDVRKIIDFFSTEVQIFFVWSPPKSGTTTFFSELRSVLQSERGWSSVLLDAKNFNMTPESEIKEKPIPLLIIDEIEDLKTVDEIKKIVAVMEQNEGIALNLILAGDNRLYEVLKNREKFITCKEIELSSSDAENTIQKLIVDTFKRRGREIHRRAAETLYSRVGGNLYLIQSLSETLCNIKRFGVIGEEVVVAFMTSAGDYLKEYSDDIMRRVMRDSRAPYAVIALMGGMLKEKSNALRGIGVVGADGLTFSSWLHENMCKQSYTPRKFAQRFSIEDWEKAIEFYDNHLSNFCQDVNEKRSTLAEASNTAFASKALLKYTSYSNQLSYLMIDRQDRIKWLEEQFIPQFAELFQTESEKHYAKLFDSMIEGVDAIARTGRARLYLTDADEMRLMCRAVIGGYEDEFKREAIPIGSEDTKIAKVYRRRNVFEELHDSNTDLEVNQNIASLGRVNSAWFFNIFRDSDSYENSSTNGDCVGTLCVDNPYHKSDPPTDSEKALITRFLILTYPFLLSAREEANRFDLQFRIDKLLSLHQHILTTDPSEEVLDHLFRVAVDLQPNLSMIVVRLVKGCNKERLRLEAARWWPERLGKIFDSPDVRIIPREESRASKILRHMKAKEDDNTLFIYDVLNSEEYEAGSALDKFIGLIKYHRLSLELGSLLMFTLETESEYLGTCSFYTHTPRVFLRDEEESLALIVKQTAVALYNAQRIDATNRQRRGMEILNRCIAMINQNLNDEMKETTPIDLKRDLSEQLGTLFKVHSASFVVPDYNSWF